MVSVRRKCDRHGEGDLRKFGGDDRRYGCGSGEREVLRLQPTFVEERVTGYGDQLRHDGCSWRGGPSALRKVVKVPVVLLRKIFLMPASGILTKDTREIF